MYKVNNMSQMSKQSFVSIFCKCSLHLHVYMWGVLSIIKVCEGIYEDLEEFF